LQIEQVLRDASVSATIAGVEDNVLEIEKSYALMAGLVFEPEWEQAFASQNNPPQSAEIVPLHFVVVVRAERIDIEGIKQQTLSFVPQQDDTHFVWFNLRPRIQGLSLVEVDFYFECHWMCTVTLRLVNMAPREFLPMLL
jgi:hypothetical protein